MLQGYKKRRWNLFHEGGKKMNPFKKNFIWKYKKKITVWKHIFEQVDGEIEVTKIEENNDHTVFTVY